MTRVVRPQIDGSRLGSTNSCILERQDIQRAIKRMAHEVVERNRGVDNLVVVGIERGGTWIARDISCELSRIEEVDTKYFPLDVSSFRDDVPRRRIEREFRPWEMVEGKTIVLCDDVLYTGRTVRAAFDALAQYGRPAQVQLAVLIDRGHREFPIRADYVGKNVPTSREEFVVVTDRGVGIERRSK
jgi:pyrimidine operon attenuation protein/uracil phosphoribosyltransferase